ncbi:MAG: hypothetical protein AB7U73_08395 [Pirellulales bacterium]
MANQRTWVIAASQASYSHAELAGQLDLLDPAHGLKNLQWRGQPLASTRALLGLSFETRTPLNPELLLDVYARQDDLVATYATSPGHDVRLQAYWRGATVGAATATAQRVDLQVSVQTALLDSAPSLYTYNVVMAREVWQPRDRSARAWDRIWQFGQPSFQIDGRARPATLLLRLESSRPAESQEFSTAPLSLLLTVHPGDLQDGRAIIDPAEPGRVAIVCQLFHEHLEKGVIRRVWQRAALFDAARDLELAGELHRAFANEEPSLTV